MDANSKTPPPEPEQMPGCTHDKIVLVAVFSAIDVYSHRSWACENCREPFGPLAARPQPAPDDPNIVTHTTGQQRVIYIPPESAPLKRKHHDTCPFRGVNAPCACPWEDVPAAPESRLVASARCISTLGTIRCEKPPDHEHDHYGYDANKKLIQWVSWPAKTARFRCQLCGLDMTEPCEHWREVFIRKFFPAGASGVVNVEGAAQEISRLYAWAAVNPGDRGEEKIASIIRKHIALPGGPKEKK